MALVDHRKKTVMQKRVNAKGQKKKADDLFSRYVRMRDGRCTLCGRTEHLQCAHLVSRRFVAIRCEPDNAAALCAKCHMRLTTEPYEHVAWCIARVGEKRYEELRALAMVGAKNVDWAAICVDLEEKVASLS